MKKHDTTKIRIGELVQIVRDFEFNEKQLIYFDEYGEPLAYIRVITGAKSISSTLALEKRLEDLGITKIENENDEYRYFS